MSSTRRQLMATLPLVTAVTLGGAVAHAGTTSAATDGAAANPFDIAADHAQAPYGDQVSAAFKNYLRASPYVGTAGAIAEGGFDEAKRLGYKTVINLNTADEGAVEEDGRVRNAGLDYLSIEVSAKAPTPEQVETFAGYVNDPSKYPILVHCMSSNRVGAMWTLYRAASGVPSEIAIQEGRTVGLKPSREAAVRTELGLPQLAN
ncbi:MAG: protein tyrosine phosphatase family protein [Alphaproteobacteria bacterium]|nr:protein tyrosine phosphatase family protein [Alphaproteobacteria bacterium]